MDAALVRALTETSQSQTTDKWYLADILLASLDLEKLLINSVISGQGKLRLWSVVQIRSLCEEEDKEQDEDRLMLSWAVLFHNRIDAGLLEPLDLSVMVMEPNGILTEAQRDALFSLKSRQLIMLLTSQNYRFEFSTGPNNSRHFYFS